MGQYYYVVNLDKKQRLHPRRFGDGLKLMELANSSCGVLCGLAVLLADGNGRGGGDFHIDPSVPDADLVGSWAGDRIVIAGDYADPGKFVEAQSPDALAYTAREAGYSDPAQLTLYGYAGVLFEDISDRVIALFRNSQEAGFGHPLSRIDVEQQSWRDRPEWSEPD